MKHSLHARVMLVIGPTLIVAALILALALRQQTVSQFVVYLSSQEQLERLEPHDRFLLRFYADRIAGVMTASEPAGITRIVDIMASTVERSIVVARNRDEFYASSRLREMELDLAVTANGILIATIEDDAQGIQAELELAPVVSEEITPFTVDDSRTGDIARVYAVPSLTPRNADSEARFVSRTTQTIVVLTAASAAVMILLIGLVVTGALQPIRVLTDAVNDLRHGGMPEPVAVEGPREVTELANAFNEMTRAIRDTEQSRVRLLADISHELRGPLSNLRSQVEAIQDGLMPADEASVSSLHEDTMLLTRLVEDLHQLTLADTSALRMDFSAASPRELVASALSPLRGSLARAEIELDVDVPEHLPAVRADLQRFSQVLRNVLSNAVRYSAGGSVRLSARTGHDDASVVVFEIADTGGGVAEEDLERIFERFYRPDPSRARSSGGSGLGLAIARAIVNAHGGEIRARANRPHGLVVTITMPRAG
ncbi:MAG: sensor histidine kinase [Spirochaetota bacterium]